MNSQVAVKVEKDIHFNEGSMAEKSQTGDFNIAKVTSIIDKYDCEKRWLISILLDIQAEYNYLPKDALLAVANKLNIPLIQVYSVASFYKVFSLKPRGKHLISACLGTACHVRGAQRVVEEIQRKLNIAAGETTPDKLFTLETVRCLGCCALGPVVVIDNNYYSHMTSKKVDTIFGKYKEENT